MVLKLMVKHRLNHGFRRVKMTKPCPSRARMRTPSSNQLRVYIIDQRETYAEGNAYHRQGR
jgi:hypothetical protein